MEVSSQEDMANPQYMKVFAVERHVLPEDFVLFVLCVECAIVATRICAESCDYLGSAIVAGIYVSGLRFPELSAQVRRPNSCTSCIPAHMDVSITLTGRNG